MTSAGYRQNSQGIFQPQEAVVHRDDEYDPAGFDVLWDMQRSHFWYHGRHRFLHHEVRRRLGGRAGLCAVDLGGGCGGWVNYLINHEPELFQQAALADSSLAALERAGELLPATIQRFQVDLLKLGWEEVWDAAFLLDVLEHLPDDGLALREAGRAVKPGGHVFVTMPALNFFWSYNDEVAHHQRRYSKSDLARLAEAAGLRLISARYFMFFLSPLLWLSRLRPGMARLGSEEKARLAARAHRVPGRLTNAVLSGVFGAETPVGHVLPFPWGTSILGVFQKPGRPIVG